MRSFLDSLYLSRYYRSSNNAKVRACQAVRESARRWLLLLGREVPDPPDQAAAHFIDSKRRLSIDDLLTKGDKDGAVDGSYIPIRLLSPSMNR